MVKFWKVLGISIFAIFFVAFKLVEIAVVGVASAMLPGLITALCCDPTLQTIGVAPIIVFGIVFVIAAGFHIKNMVEYYFGSEITDTVRHSSGRGRQPAKPVFGVINRIERNQNIAHNLFR